MLPDAKYHHRSRVYFPSEQGNRIGGVSYVTEFAEVILLWFESQTR